MTARISFLVGMVWGAAFVSFGWGVSQFWRSHHLAAVPPSMVSAGGCPYLQGAGPGPGVGDAAGPVRAYQEIERTLRENSVRNLATNAEVIAAFFRDVNPDIAASAHRLARIREVRAARDEFRNLTELFAQPADGSTPHGSGQTTI